MNEKMPKLFALARAQAGIVTYRDLTEIGFTGSDISYRVKTGLLERVLPRTYLISGAPWDRPTQMSAAARWSQGAISHRTAAVEHGLIRMPEPPPIEVSTRRPIYKAVPWVTFHRTSYLPKEHIVVLGGVPFTDPERTVMDLASVMHPRRVGHAIDGGLLAGKLSLESLLERVELEARSGRDGICLVREELAKRYDGLSPGHSGLETTVFEILSHPSLPTLERHPKISSGKGFDYEFDLGWERYRTLGEIDDYGTHGGLDPFNKDRDKLLRAQELGYAVIQITRDMSLAPDRLRDRVRNVLRARGWRDSARAHPNSPRGQS